MSGDVRLLQILDVGEEDSRDVNGDIALANDYCCIVAVEVGLQVSKLGKPIVPAYKGTRRVKAFEVWLVAEVQKAVFACAISKENRVVVIAELRYGDVTADSNVADEVKVRGGGDFGEAVLAVLEKEEWLVSKRVAGRG